MHSHIRGSMTNETAADCASVQLGKAQGWFTRDDLDTMALYMRDNPGDWTHMPGPQRDVRSDGESEPNFSP